MESIERSVAKSLLDIKAVMLNPEKPFTWASGWHSPIYCDNRRILSYPALREQVCRWMADNIISRYPDVEVIAGVATGAIAHGVLIAHFLGKPFIYVRPKPKDHGTGSQIEGILNEGARTVVVEDLISTGKSSLSAVDALNKAWAAQRWSRWVNRFDEVGLPVSGSTQGAPERMLDFRRFISDELNGFYKQVMDLVNANAPGVLLNTNAWYYSPLRYFDYAPIAYSGQLTRQGCGFYPGGSLTAPWGLMNSLFGIFRIQFESETPFWCNEFTTMTAVPGSIRKSAYASLMYGNQMVCGWTWQSMHGGEEQYLQGMLDWDGVPNRKYEEYKQIASEFQKIAPYFPYRPKAEVGIAYSFDSQMASASFPESHDSQVQSCFNLFFDRNLDVCMVDLHRSALERKLLFVPGLAVMDGESAEKIRAYVRDGGTVVMTSYSAMVDETGKVFPTTLPGRLSDVFGIRVAGFEETEAMNELSPRSYTGQKLTISYRGQSIDTQSPRFDVIELKGARQLGSIESLHQPYPVITEHRYGKLLTELSIPRGPEVPRWVMARDIDTAHTLYLNLNATPQTIPLKGRGKGILSGNSYESSFVLQPYEPELVEFE